MRSNPKKRFYGEFVERHFFFKELTRESNEQRPRINKQKEQKTNNNVILIAIKQNRLTSNNNNNEKKTKSNKRKQRKCQ